MRDPIPIIQAEQRCSTCMHRGEPLPRPEIGRMCLVFAPMRFPVVGTGCGQYERTMAPAPPPFG